MKLVNTKETFERVYTDVNEEVKPVFILRKLTYGEVAQISDETALLDKENRVAFLGGTTSRLKLKYGLVGWKNITDDAGNEMPCNEINKDKLPPDVAFWVAREIDKLNVLTDISEEERKNS